MSSRWHEKKARQAEIAFERALQNAPERAIDDVTQLVSHVAMGGGDEQVFEKKMTKEEKKAAAKAKREAKKKSSTTTKGGGDDDDDNDDDNHNNNDKTMVLAKDLVGKTKDGLAASDQQGGGGAADDGIDHEAADALAASGTICTFSASRKGVDARARDINVTNFTLQHMGSVLLDETEVVLNHGNRYGLIGSNGCGKSTLLKALGARAIPIPQFIDIFFLKEEIEPSDTITALDAVMNVDEERLRLETQAEQLNQLLGDLADNHPTTNSQQDEEDAKSPEEVQEEIMDALNMVYERLDALDASTAEVRARSILSGLGFTHEMQSKKTKDFSGGWRMRVSLARALFIQPVW
jgi:ATP-binding cassette, subfamily F, member 2